MRGGGCVREGKRRREEKRKRGKKKAAVERSLCCVRDRQRSADHGVTTPLVSVPVPSTLSREENVPSSVRSEVVIPSVAPLRSPSMPASGWLIVLPSCRKGT